MTISDITEGLDIRIHSLEESAPELREGIRENNFEELKAIVADEAPGMGHDFDDLLAVWLKCHPTYKV